VVVPSGHQPRHAQLDFQDPVIRFIDVLPSVTDDQRVVTLAQEYFGAMAAQAFRARLGPESPCGYRGGRQVERPCDSRPSRTDGAHIHCRLVCHRCDTVLDAFGTEGKAWSVDLLGEATISDQEADRYAIAAWRPSKR
jgi:RHH-type proline utilization regulon transcriptional repressor/proline dehydrogenase/delta 1-pyrroline-5-carboxylate dehydrogenase